MARHAFLGLMCVALLAAPAVAAGNADFERMLALEGEWIELDDDGKPGDHVVSVWQVTAGGTAVMETLHPGGDNIPTVRKR